MKRILRFLSVGSTITGFTMLLGSAGTYELGAEFSEIALKFAIGAVFFLGGWLSMKKLNLI